MSQASEAMDWADACEGGECTPLPPFEHRLLWFLLCQNENFSLISPKQSLRELERSVRRPRGSSGGSSSVSLANVLESEQWRLVLTVKAKRTGVFVTQAKVVTDFVSTFAEREIALRRKQTSDWRTGRLVVVNFSLEKDFSTDVVHSVARDGFGFLGARCYYFASKDPDTGNAFFLLQDENFSLQSDSPIATNISSVPPLKCSSIILAQRLRSELGAFQDLPHISLCGNRAGLLVSGTCEGLRLPFRGAASPMIEIIEVSLVTFTTSIQF